MEFGQVIDQGAIRKAYRMLSVKLSAGSKPYRRQVGYHGGSVTKTVHWHAKDGFWSLVDVAEFFWCSFGTQDPGDHDQLKITCEINSPREGTDGRYGGVFWQRGKDIYVGHTGRVGGGRVGIGKHAFISWYGYHFGITWPPGIIIGSLSSPTFTRKLAKFIYAVEEFKEQAVTTGTVDEELNRDAKHASDEGEFSGTSITDRRKKALRSINIRRGQPEFRKKLLAAYGQRCAMCECDCLEVLEAAHIRPYGGDETNHTQNGILLRGDLHTLFDLGKIGVDPKEFRIIVSKGLMSTSYAKLDRRKLRLPANRAQWPNEEVLRTHLRLWKLS